MKKLSIARSILVGLVALSLAAVMAVASVHRTKVTFSDSVHVPGATLSAGTYYFTAPESRNRAIVRIEDKDGNFVTQFMGLASYTRKPDHPIIVFGDHDCGPRAVKLWSYPDSGLVVRFVYPKEDATAIAASCNEPVPETDAPMKDAQELQSSTVRLMTPQGKEEGYKPEALSASDERDKNGVDEDPR